MTDTMSFSGDLKKNPRMPLKSTALCSLVVLSGLVMAVARASPEECTLSAMKRYLAAKILIDDADVRANGFGGSPEAIVAIRRLEENFCAEFARCLANPGNSPEKKIEYSVYFSRCLRDEESQSHGDNK